MRQNSRHRMNQRLTKLILTLSISGFLMISGAVEARSLGELLKALGNSIAHPQKKPPPRSTTHKDAIKPDASAAASPSPSATPTTEPLVRAATVAPAARGGKRDAPYGIPVPNKPGFVTSPFAPNGGYVDVRGFASGTEVKDSYTDKIFLTP